MLHTDIKEKIKEAMKARNEVEHSVLRGLSTAFTNELVANKKMPSDVLSDDEVLAVIKKQAKQNLLKDQK